MSADPQPCQLVHINRCTRLMSEFILFLAGDWYINDDIPGTQKLHELQVFSCIGVGAEDSQAFVLAQQQVEPTNSDPF